MIKKICCYKIRKGFTCHKHMIPIVTLSMVFYRLTLVGTDYQMEIVTTTTAYCIKMFDTTI